MSDHPRFCPLCRQTLKVSAKQYLYCPNVYNKAKPCTFRAINLARSTGVTKNAPSAIAPLSTPSNEQKAIFDRVSQFTKSATHILINALAGTGKTTVLVQLVRILSQVLGMSVLGIAFAKRDKLTWEGRVNGAAKIFTSNGAGMSILSAYARSQGKRLEVNNSVDYQLLENRWKEDGLIKIEGKERKWEESAQTLSAILHLVRQARTTLPLMHANPDYPSKPSNQDWMDLADRFDIEVKTESWPVVLTYATWLFTELADLKVAMVMGIDFSGQVFLPVYHDLRPSTFYQTVLVDECQDQSFVNRMIVKKFLAPSGKIIAVGDKFQAIYAWRGADKMALAEMAEMMGEHESFPLTLCRRCSKSVIKLAQCIVPAIQALPDAPEGSFNRLENEEELFQHLKEQRKGLVLCRANAPLVSLALRLLASRVPAALARSNIVEDLLRLIDHLSQGDDTLPATDLLEKLQEWAEEKLAKYAKHRDGVSKSQIVVDKVECVKALADEEGVRTVGALKVKIDELFPKDTNISAENIVLLSTIHGAKGGEAHSVYLLSPSKREASIFDEVWSDADDRDNTLYVAITRAQIDIYFVGPMPTMERFSEYDLVA